MIRSPLVRHHLLRSSGNESLTGALTNLILEIPLNAGTWAVTADCEFLAQINQAPSSGIGPRPAHFWGFRNVTASGKLIIYDGDHFVFSVPIGETRYLMIRKSVICIPDGKYFINKVT